MRNKILLSVLTIFIVLTGLITYQLLWGKLFPYSPFHPGFDEHESEHCIVYVQNGADFNNFERIDSLIVPVENFHELKFLNKPTFFIFRDKESYLQRSVSNARFCAFYNGNIVIAPWSLTEDKERKISLDIYLTHELSHSILFQNKGLLTAYKYPDWLLEGIAVYSANQLGTSFYPSKEETYSLIRKGNFLPPEYFKTYKEDEVKINFKHKAAFFYSEFACIVDYLINTYGHDAFMLYMKALLDSNDNEEVFQNIFHKDFQDVISDFRQTVRKENIEQVK